MEDSVEPCANRHAVSSNLIVCCPADIVVSQYRGNVCIFSRRTQHGIDAAQTFVSLVVARSMASTRPIGQLRVVRRHDGIELRHDPASPGKACIDRLIKHRPRQNDGVHVQQFLFLCSTAIPYQCAASPKTPIPIRSLWQIGTAPLRWQAEKKCLGKFSGLSGHPCMGSRAGMTSSLVNF